MKSQIIRVGKVETDVKSLKLGQGNYTADWAYSPGSNSTEADAARSWVKLRRHLIVATAEKEASIAFVPALTQGTGSIAIGDKVKVNSPSGNLGDTQAAIAIGQNAETSSTNAIAIGHK